MKNKTFLALSSSLACLFLLAACTDVGMPNTNGTSNKNTQTTQSDLTNQDVNQNTSLVINPSQEIPEKMLTQQYMLTQTDKVAFDAALQLKDPTYCEKIADPETQKNCKDMIEKAQIVSDATRLNDKEICNKLTDEDSKQACILKVEVNNEIMKKNADPTQKDQDLFKQAFDTKDPSICEGIQNDDYRTSCEFQAKSST